MLGNFEACVGFVLLPEDDGQPFHVTRGDAGGATSWGITQATYSRWLKRPASIADMQALTRENTLPIYHDWYWLPIAGDQLLAGVDLMVFDHGVLCGEHETAVELQDSLLVDADGHIGPITLSTLDRMDADVMINSLRIHQERFYRSRPSFAEFGRGWLNRLDRRASAAKALLSSSHN